MESVRMRKGSPKKDTRVDDSILKPSFTREVDIYMLVNPISGSREAVAYSELPWKLHEFTMEDKTEVHLKIVNILIPQEAEKVKDDVADSVKAKSLLTPGTSKNVIVLFWAGDGTFMNIVQEFKNHGIDINALLFAVFPFGTANDVSRNFGWGSVPSNKMLQDLHLVCAEVLAAKEIAFDVWEIDIQTDDEKGDIQRAVGYDLLSINETKITKYMSHSFSFGSDARTGLAFERRRTRNRVWNRIRYAFEGFKNFIRCWGERTMKIKELMKSFDQLGEEDEGQEKFEKFNSCEEAKEDTALTAEFSKGRHRIVAANKDIDADYFLIRNPVSFYWLNLPSIMNGNINLWAGGRNSVGYETYEGRRVRDKVYLTEPAFDDGKLEFATFDSLLYYILNWGNSIAQGGGPYEIQFIDDTNTRTYLNIDGEFYKMFNIRRIQIRKAKSLCTNGCLRVLFNERREIFD